MFVCLFVFHQRIFCFSLIWFLLFWHRVSGFPPPPNASIVEVYYHAWLHSYFHMQFEYRGRGVYVCVCDYFLFSTVLEIKSRAFVHSQLALYHWATSPVHLNILYIYIYVCVHIYTHTHTNIKHNFIEHIWTKHLFSVRFIKSYKKFGGPLER